MGLQIKDLSGAGCCAGQSEECFDASDVAACTKLARRRGCEWRAGEDADCTPTPSIPTSPFCYPQNLCDAGYMDKPWGELDYWYECEEGCPSDECECACVPEAPCAIFEFPSENPTALPSPSPTADPTSSGLESGAARSIEKEQDLGYGVNDSGDEAAEDSLNLAAVLGAALAFVAVVVIGVALCYALRRKDGKAEKVSDEMIVEEDVPDATVEMVVEASSTM